MICSIEVGGRLSDDVISDIEAIIRASGLNAFSLATALLLDAYGNAGVQEGLWDEGDYNHDYWSLTIPGRFLAIKEKLLPIIRATVQEVCNEIRPA